ncbi:hypothetical protein HF086_005590 [Spodoptera exigua]|uniref:Uncharacterized protein n=1 Tax=Spodoptera exigua TaxID=7107 RepID=A0A922MZ84_SPOEX|nr:hypothetical protein HF086_005590 [Spodoptera exigua]
MYEYNKEPSKFKKRKVKVKIGSLWLHGNQSWIPSLTHFWDQMHLLIILLLPATVHCYHRDYGPVFGPFLPTYVDLATECAETETHSCLVLPTKKICREKLGLSLNPYAPLPWWYFYCQWVVTQPPVPMTKTSTVHPFYRKTLDAVLEYKKRLKEGNNLFK